MSCFHTTTAGWKYLARARLLFHAMCPWLCGLRAPSPTLRGCGVRELLLMSCVSCLYVYIYANFGIWLSSLALRLFRAGAAVESEEAEGRRI